VKSTVKENFEKLVVY